MFIILLLGAHTLHAQFEQLSYPTIHQFQKQSHGGGTQTWDIEHLSSGFSFFANNDGVLFYDRVDWHLIQTPDKTIVRSLAFDKDNNQLYIGGQGELGYINLDEFPFEYQDLLPKLSKEQRADLTDIWEMVLHDDQLYFRSTDRIYSYDRQSFQVYDPKADITFLQKIEGRLIFNQVGKGIYSLEGDTVQLFSRHPDLLDAQVIDALDLPGAGHLLLTNGRGIYIYNGENYEPFVTNSDSLLRSSLIQSAYYWESQDKICVGTFLAGLLTFDLNGKLLQVIDKEKGLNNNTISAINADSSDILWIGSYLDISAIPLQQENQKLYPDGELEGAIYDIEIWNGHYYFASSNGLYSLPRKDYYPPSHQTPFQLIPNSEGECWGLDLIGDDLFVAHNKGAFKLEPGGHLSTLPAGPGAWKFIPLSEHLLAVGTYEGIQVLERTGKDWSFSHKIKDFTVSSRIMVQTEDGTLWVTHPYKGIFKLSSANAFETVDVEKIDENKGIPNLVNCYGHLWNGQFLVSNDTAIYAYDQNLDTFIRDPNFNRLFEDERLIRILHQDSTYYISDKAAGMLRKEITGSIVEVKKERILPNNKSFIGGFENLKAVKDLLLLCTDQGITIHQKSNKYSDTKLVFQKLIIEPSDRKLYFSMEPDKNEIVLNNNTTGFRVDYVALGRQVPIGNVLYSSRMEGLEKEWSEWSPQPWRNFQNIGAGDYIFELRASHNGKVLNETIRQKITIKNHILWTPMAKSIYGVVFIGLIFTAIFIPTQKQKKEKKQILKEKQKADSEVKNLRRQNYNIQLEAKNKELASSTMHLLQKNELITDVKEVIADIKNKVKDRTAKKELKKLENKLKDDQRLEDEWENFSIHFNKVHNNFFDRLKEEHPKLTPKDLKLCAYLRLNLTTKEIAPLLGISIRGVEVSRYRLRKKLDLDGEVNLNEFMMGF